MLSRLLVGHRGGFVVFGGLGMFVSWQSIVWFFLLDGSLQSDFIGSILSAVEWPLSKGAHWIVAVISVRSDA